MGEGHPNSTTGEGVGARKQGNARLHGQEFHSQSEPHGPRAARPATDGSTRPISNQDASSTREGEPKRFLHSVLLTRTAHGLHRLPRGTTEPTAALRHPCDPEGRAGTPVSFPTPRRWIAHRSEDSSLYRLVPHTRTSTEDRPASRTKCALLPETEAPRGSAKPNEMRQDRVKEHGIGSE